MDETRTPNYGLRQRNTKVNYSELDSKGFSSPTTPSRVLNSANHKRKAVTSDDSFTRDESSNTSITMSGKFSPESSDMENYSPVKIKKSKKDQKSRLDKKNVKEMPVSPVKTEYEAMRLKNIEERKAFYNSLRITESKQLFEIMMGPKKTEKKARLPKVKDEQNVLPPKKSLRLQGKAPDGEELNPVTSQDASNSSENNEQKPPRDLTIDETCIQDMAEKSKNFIRDLAKNINANSPGKNLFYKSFNSMKLNEKNIWKIVPNRIISLAFHPTNSKVLLSVGDKRGNITLWDKNQEKDGIFNFQPHSSHVSRLRFSKENELHLFSSSYDGFIRCFDIQQEMFLNKHFPGEHEDGISHFDFLPLNTIICTHKDGSVTTFDERCDFNSSNYNRFQLTHKALKTVSVHPKQTSYFATSCGDGTTSIWDIRKLSKSSPKAVVNLSHNRSVSSAFFSPVTGNKLLTISYDNLISIYDTTVLNSNIEVSLSIPHFNQTGRWLTPFKAFWPGNSETNFAVGSMKGTRKIEVFSASTGLIQHEFQNELMTSVCSVIDFHPSMQIMAGGNASGKVFCFESND